MNGAAQANCAAVAFTAEARRSRTAPGRSSSAGVASTTAAGALEPAPLTAVTLNAYAVPAASPVTRAPVPVTVAVPPPATV